MAILAPQDKNAPGEPIDMVTADKCPGQVASQLLSDQVRSLVAFDGMVQIDLE